MGLPKGSNFDNEVMLVAELVLNLFKGYETITKSLIPCEVQNVRKYIIFAILSCPMCNADFLKVGREKGC